MSTQLQRLTTAKGFYQITGYCLPYLLIVTGLLLACGLFTGLVLAPPDYQQGDAFRIIYVHVPSAIMSLVIYLWMAFCALSYLVWRIKLAALLMRLSAPLGAWLTALALLTGSIWGKPMWGTWWIWDARLTAELILLFLYLGVIALQQAIRHRHYAAQAVAILILLGALDIPIIHYSVNWWSTLHQGASISQWAKPTIAPEMLYPLLIMLAGFFMYFVSLLTWRARYHLLWQQRDSVWVKSL